MSDDPRRVDESALRDWMRDGAGDTPRLDTGTVIRKARRRRRAAQLGTGSLAALAVAGMTVLGVQALGNLPGGNLLTAADMAESDSAESNLESNGAESDLGASTSEPAAPEAASPFAGGDDDANSGPPFAATLNTCGAAVVEVPPSGTGLILTPEFPERVAAGERVEGTVTMTNTGPDRIRGTTQRNPVMTLSRDGITMWHSSGPSTSDEVSVDLYPGESMSYAASFFPVVCSTEGELEPPFRADLPPASPGGYELSAALEIGRYGEPRPTLITGPTQSVTVE